MRIALVSYEYPPDTAYGGIATYTQQMAKMLCGRGHTVEVFAASDKRAGSEGGDRLRVNLVNELDTERFADKVAQVFRERQSIRAFDVVESPEYNANGREILSTHPDIAHVVKLHTPSELLREISCCQLHISGWIRHYVGQTRVALGAVRRGRRPAPFRKPEAKSAAKAIEFIERNYVKMCDFVVSPSQSLLNWAVANWSIDPGNSMVVPNPYVPADSLLDIGVRRNGKVVGFFGRLEYRKGVTDLVDAIPLILRGEPDTRFHFVGKALIHPGTLEPFDKYIRRKLRRHMDRVTLVGQRSLEEMPREYSGVDICVFPSIWENFPNVCLESMAAGRGIVASSAGGMAEMLEEGGGILVPPRSPRQLADAVIEFIRCPELRSTAGGQARREVLERYSSDKILPAVERSYERAIAANRRKYGYNL